MKDHKVDVFLDEKPVGTLAETAEHRIAFAYADSWLESGLDGGTVLFVQKRITIVIAPARMQVLNLCGAGRRTDDRLWRKFHRF